MKFKAGDRVQFKTWEEMEKEYGLDDDGDIPCKYFFIDSMRHLCGTFATICRIGQDGYTVYLQDFTAKGRTLFAYALDMLKPATDKYELHIISDGKTTNAVYKKNGKVVARSQARKHPDDEFNFKTGATIAFDRAFQPEPEKKEPKKLRLFSVAGKCYGTVGNPTRYKDINGRPLFVGDIVELENAINPKQFVCEDEDGAFICGIKNSCNIELGVICGWTVRLATPFTEVKDGTKVALVTCRLK
jgi:hypothetical protein